MVSNFVISIHAWHPTPDTRHPTPDTRQTDFSRDSRYSLAMKNMLENMAGNSVPRMQVALMVVLILAQISNMVAESAHYVGTPTKQ